MFVLDGPLPNAWGPYEGTLAALSWTWLSCLFGIQRIHGHRKPHNFPNPSIEILEDE